MPEWSNGTDSKSVVLRKLNRGFESLSLRQFSHSKKNNPDKSGLF